LWAACENGTVLRSLDGGNEWLPQYLPAGFDLRSIETRGGQVLWAVGEEGEALRSDDGGFTWKKTYPGPARKLNSVSAIDPQKAWIVGEGGVILKTDDGGKSWEEQRSGTTADLRSISCRSEESMWAAGSGGTVLFSDDGGEVWQPRNCPEEVDLNEIYSWGGEKAWAVGPGGRVFLTRDGGYSWDVKDVCEGETLLSVSGHEDRVIWVAGRRGVLLRSEDGGETWRRVSPPRETDLLRVKAVGETGLVVTGAGGLVARSRDGGENWEILEAEIDGELWGLALSDLETVWAAGWRGVILHWRKSPRLDALYPSTAEVDSTVTLVGISLGDGGEGCRVIAGEAEVRSWSTWTDRLIRIQLPSNSEPRTPIRVITPHGTSLPREVSVLPKVRGVSPLRCYPGATMTISGSAFGRERGSSYVLLGKSKITDFITWGNQLIRFKVPGGLPDTLEVKVVTGVGPSNAKKALFSSTPPAQISGGPAPRPRIDFLEPDPVLPGKELHIYGAHFGHHRDDAYVLFGNERAAQYPSWKDDHLVVVVPGQVEGRVQVRVVTRTGPSNLKPLEVLAVPLIRHLSPPVAAERSPVEVHGKGFGPREDSRHFVALGGRRIESYEFWSDTRIVFLLPNDVRGETEVTVNTPVTSSA
ncbi:MAG: IPT/TIG domain-containing protein, partial [Candidatus Geothermincolales bacterium]